MYNPEDYWNKRGANYRGSDDVLPEIENLKKIVKHFTDYDSMFIEVGTGYGRIYNALEPHIHNIGIGIETKDILPIVCSNYKMCDFVESMRYRCEQNTGRLPDYWDGKTLPYPDNYFDFVISFSVLLHAPPCEIERVFAEHVRVCRKHFFIATYAGGLERLAEHCFEHDYKKLFEKYDLKIIDEKFFQDGLRVNWLLEVGK